MGQKYLKFEWESHWKQLIYCEGFVNFSIFYHKGTSTYYVTRFSKISDPPSPLVTKNRTNLYILTMVRNKQNKKSVKKLYFCPTVKVKNYLNLSWVIYSHFSGEKKIITIIKNCPKSIMENYKLHTSNIVLYNRFWSIKKIFFSPWFGSKIYKFWANFYWKPSIFFCEILKKFPLWADFSKMAQKIFSNLPFWNP